MTKHTRINIYLIFETILVFIALSLLAIYISQLDIKKLYKTLIYIPILIFQGLWFYRFYIVGHEASHKKLFLKNKKLNDAVGSIILLPLMTPINVFRKIHMFHHGFNRKDNHTSALDTFTTKKTTILKKIYFYTLWYLGVFFGGFFIHSLISVILFLFLPPKISIKISPAFKGWTWNDQFKAIGLFILGISFHLLIYKIGGWHIYLYTILFPLLSFAWVLSLLVYVLHYDTTVGENVRYNVRSVKNVPIISWILLNFNEHATHHQNPNIPWYQLPKKSKPLPEEFHNKNQTTTNFFVAILNQLKGPRIINE